VHLARARRALGWIPFKAPATVATEGFFFGCDCIHDFMFATAGTAAASSAAIVPRCSKKRRKLRSAVTINWA
jgi:hypothetical protein